jgi:hypothetical protein
MSTLGSGVSSDSTGACVFAGVSSGTGVSDALHADSKIKEKIKAKMAFFIIHLFRERMFFYNKAQTA